MLALWNNSHCTSSKDFSMDLVIIGSDNGLSYIRRWSNTWTKYWVIVMWSMGLLPDTSNCGCACAGNVGNVFPATAGKQSRHASRHVRDARAVMHAGITRGCLWIRRRGKTFPAFPAHEQPAILRICPLDTKFNLERWQIHKVSLVQILHQTKPKQKAFIQQNLQCQHPMILSTILFP